MDNEGMELKIQKIDVSSKKKARLHEGVGSPVEKSVANMINREPENQYFEGV